MSAPTSCPHCDRAVGPKHFYRSGKARCQNRMKWTRRMQFELASLIDQGKTADQIAAKLGVSRNAVIIARKRYGIQNVQDVSLSGFEVARLMGFHDGKTVTAWITRGFLRAKRLKYGARTNSQPWFVRREWLFDFVADERTWHLWTIDRITDPALRTWAVAKRGDVHFLTPREFAHLHCVEHSTVNQWIHKGWLPARRWGNWWIDSRVAATWSHERGVSDMPNLHDRRAGAAALAALRRSERAA